MRRLCAGGEPQCHVLLHTTPRVQAARITHVRGVSGEREVGCGNATAPLLQARASLPRRRKTITEAPHVTVSTGAVHVSRLVRAWRTPPLSSCCVPRYPRSCAPASRRDEGANIARPPPRTGSPSRTGVTEASSAFSASFSVSSDFSRRAFSAQGAEHRVPLTYYSTAVYQSIVLSGRPPCARGGRCCRGGCLHTTLGGVFYDKDQSGNKNKTCQQRTSGRSFFVKKIFLYIFFAL